MRIHGAANADVEHGGSKLRIWKKYFGLRGRSEAVVLNVSEHADHLARRESADPHELAKRILVGPEAPRGGLIHHHHRGRLGIVEIGECTACNERHAHRLGIIGANRFDEDDCPASKINFRLAFKPSRSAVSGKDG